MDERSTRIAKRLEIPMLVITALVVPVLVIEASNFGEPWDTIGQVGNWAIWLAFVGELVIMLSVVPDRRAWLRSHPLDLLIVLLTPPVLPAGLQAARLLRLFRLLRLLRLAQLSRQVFSLRGVGYVALLTVLNVVAGGYAFSVIEDGPHGSDLSDWDGIWWALSTVVTGGYGDIKPHTDSGRAIAIVVMVVGVGFVAMIIAALAESFVKEELQEAEEAAEDAAGAAEDAAATNRAVLEELRALGDRIGRLETAIAGRRHST